MVDIRPNYERQVLGGCPDRTTAALGQLVASECNLTTEVPTR
jgi:hypothetical protein